LISRFIQNNPQVRISATHGLVGFDVSGDGGPYSGSGGGAAVWLHSMDFNSEEYCHVSQEASASANDDDLINDDIVLRRRRLTDLINDDIVLRRRRLTENFVPAAGFRDLFRLLRLPALRVVDFMVGSFGGGGGVGLVGTDPAAAAAVAAAAAAAQVDAARTAHAAAGKRDQARRRLAHAARRAQRKRLLLASATETTAAATTRTTTAATTTPSPTPSPSLATLYPTCEGDGSMDRAMVFLGQPSEVRRVLSSLVYMSAVPNVNDVVTVQVHTLNCPNFPHLLNLSIRAC
jgi:hypothetical protein